MTPSDFEEIQRWLCCEALSVIGYPEVEKSSAYKAMTHEPEFLPNWWSGVFEKDETESALLNSAARALIRREPLPQLTLEQRGRLALRMRLCSRIVRAFGSRNTVRKAKGWFPAKLYKLSEPELLEWLLVDAWPVCVEILDEALLWADEFQHPPAPSIKRETGQSSASDASSFSA